MKFQNRHFDCLFLLYSPAGNELIVLSSLLCGDPFRWGTKGSKGSEGSEDGGIALSGDAYEVSVTD